MKNKILGICTKKFFLNDNLLYRKTNDNGIKMRFWNLIKYDKQRRIDINKSILLEWLSLFIKNILKYKIITVKKSNDNIWKLNIEKQLKITSEKILSLMSLFAEGKKKIQSKIIKFKALTIHKL
mgnify:CR=1 FL=1